jgi:hypothetical protein
MSGFGSWERYWKSVCDKGSDELSTLGIWSSLNFSNFFVLSPPCFVVSLSGAFNDE